jgi:O-antigen/teichoic acid export membrane protein
MSLIKSSIKDSGIYGFCLVLVRLSSLVTLPLLTRVFSPKEYAVVGLILMIMPFTRFMIPLEVSQAVTVFIVDAKRPSDKGKYFSSGFWFTLAINFFVLSATLLVCRLLHVAESYNLSFLAIAFLFFGLFVDSLGYYCMNLIRWEGFKYFYIFNSIVTAWVTVAGLLIALLVFHLGLDGVFYAWTIAWSVSFLLSLARVFKYLSFKMSLKRLSEMLTFSFPLFLNNVPATLNQLLDRYIILFIIGLTAVGFYSASFAMASLASFVPMVLQLAIWPMVYRSHKEPNAEKRVTELLKLFLHIFLYLILISTIICKPTLTLFLGPKFLASSDVQLIAPILVLNVLIGGLKTFFPGMAISRKTQYVLKSTIISLVSNLILGIILAFIAGIKGVAIALLISTLLKMGTYAWYSQKFFKLHIKKAEILKYSFIATPTILLAYVANFFLPALTLAGIAERVAFICVAALTGVFFYVHNRKTSF